MTEKMSPHDILRNHGKWIGSEEFVKLVAEKNQISKRQAQRQISGEFEEKKLKKHVFPDRTVIYGIDEFGPPTINASTQVIRNKLGVLEYLEKRALRKEEERWNERKRKMAPALAHMRKRAAEGNETFRRVVEEEDKLDAEMQRKFKKLR